MEYEEFVKQTRNLKRQCEKLQEKFSEEFPIKKGTKINVRGTEYFFAGIRFEKPLRTSYNVMANPIKKNGEPSKAEHSVYWCHSKSVGEVLKDLGINP